MKKSVFTLISSLAIVGLTSTVAYAAIFPNPAGELLDRVDLSIPANPIVSVSAFTPDTLADDELLGGVLGCELTGGSVSDSHPFVTDTITVGVGGSFTFRVVGSAGVRDPFLALYSGTFDRLDPDSGVLGCNDDAGARDGDTFVAAGDGYAYPAINELWSQFSVTLTAGTYTVMMTTYDNFANDTAWYDRNGDSGVGSVSTATFEYWGPSGGLVSASPSNSAASTEIGVPGIFLSVTGGAGSLFEGRKVIYGSYAVAPNSAYKLTVQSISNPWRETRVLASGVVNSGGHLEATTVLPRMAADSYRIVFEGVAVNGQPLKLTNHVNVNAAGRFTSISAERLQPLLR